LFVAKNFLRKMFAFEAPKKKAFVLLIVNCPDEDTEVVIDAAVWG
jgi:hypothetical protein